MPEPKATKNRVHLDLRAMDRLRKVERLRALGAAVLDDQIDGGRFVVRREASGTPVGPFFGVETPTGRSFAIMSIDILTLEEGKIVHIFHLEDWTSATAQLTSGE